jgi:hypothetical protein
MKKKSATETTRNELNRTNTSNQKSIKQMPENPLPQPKEYDEIEY